MSVARAQQEISSAEFSDWIAHWHIRHGAPRPQTRPVERSRTDDDLMAQAIAWRDRMNARPN